MNSVFLNKRLLPLLLTLPLLLWTLRGEEDTPDRDLSQPQAVTVEAESPPAKEEAKQPERPSRKRSRSRGDADAPAIFGASIVPAGERVGDAVSVCGRTEVDGEVGGDAVAVFGPMFNRGKVNGDAVAVFGNLKTTGVVKGSAVCVFGNAEINGPVDDELVVIFGDLKLGPNAEVKNTATVVFGHIDRDPDASLGMVNIVGMLPKFKGLGSIGTWGSECLARGRLLGFSEGLGLAWMIAGAHLLFYVFLALVMRKPTEYCIDTLVARPGMSLVSSVLAFLLTPVLVILLAVTGVGAVLLPFLFLGLVFLSFFSRVVMLGWIGRPLTRLWGDSPLNHVAFAVIIGGLFVSLLYCVPVVALLVHSVLGSIGFGVVILAILQAAKREKKQTPPAPPASGAFTSSSFQAPAPASAESVSGPAVGLGSAGFAAAAEPSVSAAAGLEPPVAAESAAVPLVVPPVPEAASGFARNEASSFRAQPRPSSPPASALPRATFWLRMGSLGIDLVIMIILTGVISSFVPSFMRHFLPSGPISFLFPMAIYGALMWKLRGTTIGGIICRLEVVRTDDRPMDWTTCVVRGLGCILSAFCLGLGFLWIIWDPKGESWHDKIAGTAVVVLPDSKPLV